MGPSVFIGSSSEGKRYAEYLQAALDEHCESTVWDQGVFGLSESSLRALVTESRRVDFAVLVLTPDDVVTARGQRRHSARDNVVFEVGLFIGALGPERTIIVHDAGADLHFPSDLAGITTCTFRGQRTDANFRAAVNPAARRIREVIEHLGARDPSPRQAKPAPRTTTLPPRWTRESLLETLSERVGAEGVAIARRLFTWADQRPSLTESFGRGTRDGSWSVGYAEEHRYLWPFVLYTYGRIELQFQHIAKRPPFDDQALRAKLHQRVTAIPGVVISRAALDHRPAFGLLALKDQRAFSRFTQSMDWAFQMANAQEPAA